MPSGARYIVIADHNTVVAKQYFICTSLALPKQVSKQKQKKRLKKKKKLIYNFYCKQPIFVAYTILCLLYSKVKIIMHYINVNVSPREAVSLL